MDINNNKKICLVFLQRVRMKDGDGGKWKDFPKHNRKPKNLKMFTFQMTVLHQAKTNQ